jgi:type II secretory pathway component GspD/PulD (secretin)
MRYVLAGMSLLVGLLLDLRTVADEPTATAPKSISLEVIIADVPEGTAESLQPAAILALEKAGKLSSVNRFRLTTAENQRATVQFSELTPRATGRTVAGGFRGDGAAGAGPRSSTNYTDISVGTMLSAVARVEDDGQLAIELKVTRSRLVPQKAEAADAAGEFTPTSIATLTVESSLKAKLGEPTLVGGRQTTGGKDAAQTWVVLTANISGAAAGGTSGKPAAGGAAANQIKIYKLKYAVADQLALVLKHALSDAPLSITSDAQTNSLLVRGPTERIVVVETLLQQLDVGRP